MQGADTFPFPYRLVVFRNTPQGVEVLYSSETLDFVSSLRKIEELTEEVSEFREEVPYSEDILKYPESFMEEEGWYLLEKPFWTKVGSNFFLSEKVPGLLEGAYLFTPVVRKKEEDYIFYSIKAEHPLRFPTVADSSAAQLCSAVFVPYEPNGENVNEIQEDEILVEEIGEEGETPRIFGYWPWDPYLLATRISYYANLSKIDGPVFLVVHPQAILGEEAEETSRKLSQLFGSETLGAFVLVNISFPIEKEEDGDKEGDN